MKQKALILGAKGMLGQELARQFGNDQAYEVVAWDREDINVADEKEMQEKVSSQKPNIIIYSVGYNAVDKAEESEEEFQMAMKLNAQAPRILAQLAKELDAVFVHYVSDYVFDGEKGEYTEDDETHAISKYGESKERGEKNVLGIGGKYYLIRTSKLFGEPASSANAKKAFFRIMMDLAKTNKTLKVVDSERSCFTYVPDLAKATKQMIEGKHEYGIYHIVNEGAVTWYEGLVRLFEIAGIKDVDLVPVGADEFPRPAKRAVSSVLVNTKFPKLRAYDEALKEWLKI